MPHVQIAMSGGVTGTRVSIDGRDISHLLRGVTLSHELGGLPKVTLLLAAGAAAADVNTLIDYIHVEQPFVETTTMGSETRQYMPAAEVDA